MDNLAKVVKAKDQEFLKIASQNKELIQSLDEAKAKMKYFQQKEKEVYAKNLELANLKEALVESEKILKASKSEVASVVGQNKSLVKTNGVLQAELELTKETNNNLQKKVGEREKMLEEVRYQKEEENVKLNDDKMSLEEEIVKSGLLDEAVLGRDPPDLDGYRSGLEPPESPPRDENAGYWICRADDPECV